jgi:hypothetical protein
VFGKLQDLQKSSSAGVKRIRDEAPRRPIASLKM